SGVRSPESGVRSLESGVRSPESGVWSPESGDERLSLEAKVSHPKPFCHRSSSQLKTVPTLV
ncbi:MAG: hypothetical protein J2P41_14165, partial [Blastocatellia bacterium]|nr:hypothetical protein [Blastocatellia bacterium]